MSDKHYARVWKDNSWHCVARRAPYFAALLFVQSSLKFDLLSFHLFSFTYFALIVFVLVTFWNIFLSTVFFDWFQLFEVSFVFTSKTFCITSKEWARNRLRQKHRIDPHFNYLLKLREKKLDQYILLYLRPLQSQPEFHEIEQVFDEPSSSLRFHLAADGSNKFTSVLQLLEFYRKDGNSSTMYLQRCVLPVNPGSDLTVLALKLLSLNQTLFYLWQRYNGWY